MFAGTEGDGIYLSMNNDTNWMALNTGLTNKYVYQIISVDTFLFAVADTAELSASGGIFRSSNKGASWLEIDKGLEDTAVTALAFYKDKSGITNLFAGVWGGGIYRSTDYGNNWIKYENELSNYSIIDLAIMDTTLFAVADSKVFLSNDNSKNWLEVSDGLNHGAILLATNDTILFASAGNEVYYSLDRGLQWSYGEGLGHSINCIEVCGKYLFIGIGAPFFVSQTVWRRPLSELTKPMGIKKDAEQVYSYFKLNQNYPNPFNPSTTISWELTTGTNVQIKIYDLLGKEIKTLVNQYYSSGYHKVTVNFKGLSSGLYFYRLQAGSYSTTKKLILLR